MNEKIGLRAFSTLLVVMLVSVVLVPAVSASDSKSKDEQMSNRSASEKAPVHFGDLTEMRIADEKEVYAKIPSSIKNYDLVVFDLPKIREHLLHGDQLTVYLEGQTVMWGCFMKSAWLQFSANDGFYGDANHDNSRRITETKGVVASYC